MKISFVLPPFSEKPIGGYKIVFQYANQFVAMGHDVTICFLNYLYPEKIPKTKKIISFLKHKFSGDFEINWFKLDTRVKVLNNIIFASEIPTSDVVVATAVQTAFWMDNLDERLGKKVYFIQGYETWAYSEKVLIDSFKLKMKKIVIANWLKEKINKYTKDKISVVPNFLDGSVYNFAQSIPNRHNIVAMMYHVSDLKNIGFGMDVLQDVHKVVPNLQVRMFGAYDTPQNLPNYFSYIQDPTQQYLRDQIYGKAKVYLLPSLSEGWGLTGMEAMSAGSVLVSSDIEGVREYAVNKKNSFLITPNKKDIFCNKIISILASEDERVKIARMGVSDIRKYSLASSAQNMENIFLNLVR
ncbi:glycosyltransferase family 4 protein [Lactiplantibacillus nangangensis]|uniref:Glycosyltransferase family 4 protein n=1 Tax=Lactiplantibacillus nangangensis TaxID=2559917 RepID=A0ABW1SIN9_9LACO|nr:glycosyltransferase family 4 protein [Lactiplantibacillus nangangensis]